MVVERLGREATSCVASRGIVGVDGRFIADLISCPGAVYLSMCRACMLYRLQSLQVWMVAQEMRALGRAYQVVRQLA